MEVLSEFLRGLIPHEALPGDAIPLGGPICLEVALFKIPVDPIPFNGCLFKSLGDPFVLAGSHSP